MKLHRLSTMLPWFDGNSRPWESLDTIRVLGIAVMIIGASQLPIAFVLSGNSLSLFVIGNGGWVLIFLGVNLARGKAALEDGWFGSESNGWTTTAIIVVLAIAAAVASGMTVWAS